MHVHCVPAPRPGRVCSRPGAPDVKDGVSFFRLRNQRMVSGFEGIADAKAWLMFATTSVAVLACYLASNWIPTAAVFSEPVSTSLVAEVGTPQVG
ncbi:hypothetical protein N658DRAFT_329709 [Parathielavia hyrcaniae]|uniref:Uncharacterized protein n=1 Tax=Parathielavia hyrcaniae TaxID=113614 RepID=A0AAN6Q910_9PEZI|nr:hypothetical protein N658DRAFT_329709 [Parathielavia hyrcaniae]